MRYLVLLTTLLLAAAAQAEVQPYLAGSLKKIESERRGKPFILTFWSASCTHCPSELRALGELVRQHPRLDLVIVATDTPAESPELQRLAQSYGLAEQTQWVFADAQPERLRYEIDRRWYGELPRTYFYDRHHHREGRSGAIPAEQLERWAGEHVK